MFPSPDPDFLSEEEMSKDLMLMEFLASFYVTASDAERILDTEFHYYRNSLTDVERIRTLQYSVPKDLHQYIQMIQPTTRFGQMQRSIGYEQFVVGPSTNSMKQYSGESLNVTFCNTTISPQCLKDLYFVGDFRGSSTNGGKMGICGYLNEVRLKFSLPINHWSQCCETRLVSKDRGLTLSCS